MYGGGGIKVISRMMGEHTRGNMCEIIGGNTSKIMNHVRRIHI